MERYGKKYPSNWNSLTMNQKISSLIKAMNSLIGNEDFKKDLISLHPDLELISEYQEIVNPKKYYKADGENSKPVVVKEVEITEKKDIDIPKTTNILMGIGAGILTVFLIKNILT